VIKVNPFAGVAGAVANSSYGRIDGGLLTPAERTGVGRRMTQEVHQALRALLHDPDFPCVGAKSIVNQSSYRFGLYRELAEAGSTAGLAFDLWRFIEEQPAMAGEFSSYIACFAAPKVRTPKAFEALLWRQLRALHELDRPHHAWSDTVSADPADPRFSFSFAGKAFFVVGLSPAAGRWARRFPWPTLVFNDHAQFERLRQEQRFDRMRDVIRGRDEVLHGAPNEALADFGAHSEARQYAGRRVGAAWRCPVHFDVPGDEA
jgi:FPC/CPF motif-containing protein YcgG